jgi:hypothetical protein
MFAMGKKRTSIHREGLPIEFSSPTRSPAGSAVERLGSGRRSETSASVFMSTTVHFCAFASSPRFAAAALAATWRAHYHGRAPPVNAFGIGRLRCLPTVLLSHLPGVFILPKFSAMPGALDVRAKPLRTDLLTVASKIGTVYRFRAIASQVSIGRVRRMHSKADMA